MDAIVLLGPDGQVVCERCEIAGDFVRRGRGLLGRKELNRGQGMLIRPTWSVHTWFMRFAIDVVFLDSDLTVLKIARRLPTFRPVWDVRRGVTQLRDAFSKLGLAQDDLEGDRFLRIRRIKRLLESGRLDRDLRWVNA